MLGRLRRRFARGGVVLLYHSVADVALDPWALHVSPARFAEHLEVLRGWGTPMRLREMVAAGGRLPRRAVAVTFDDGYANNLHVAAPALERAGIPATVFVTTGWIGGGREAWWDELEQLVLHSAPLPERLRLRVNGSWREWEPGSAEGGEEQDRQGTGWLAWEDAPTARHAAYRDLWEVLRPLDDEARKEALAELASQTGRRPVLRATHRPLARPEVVELGTRAGIEVGAHTVTHPSLAGLAPRRQQQEITCGKATLEGWLGAPVRSFAYPYGKEHDYTAETTALVRAAGCECACSNFPGVVDGRTDAFQMPRMAVRNHDGDAFAAELARWFA